MILINTHTHTHTRTHARTHIHTHTHTHTHTQLLASFCSFSAAVTLCTQRIVTIINVYIDRNNLQVE